MTCPVKISEGTATKTVTLYRHFGVFDREVYWLDALSGSPRTPDLISSDELSMEIVMSDCGKLINHSNLPEDWEEQCEDILVELEAIAPVHGVMGNMDGFDLAHRLPMRAVVDLDGLRVGLAHGHLHGGPSDRHSRLREAFRSDGVHAVIYGHTHRACADTEDEPWVLNPGSASQGRGHGRSIGLLRVAEDGALDFEIVRLD